jgi:hypothetical protein
VSETKLVNACLEWLWDHGIPAFRVNSGNVFVGKKMVRGAPPGTPDIIGWFPDGDGPFGIECKLPGKSMSKAQDAWCNEFNGQGFRYYCVSDVWQLPNLMDITVYSFHSPSTLRDLLAPPTKEKSAFARIAPKGRIVNEETPATEPPVRVRRRRTKRA